MELATRLLRYKDQYRRLTGRWFQGHGEECKVTTNPHFAGEGRNPCHVDYFFDGTVTEEDVLNGTVGQRIREAEARPDSSSSSSSSYVQDAADGMGSSEGFLKQMRNSFSSWGRKMRAAFL